LTDKTLQYYRRHRWEKLYQSLIKDDIQLRDLSWMSTESKMHWGKGETTSWQRKLAPFPIKKLTPELKREVQKIRGQMPPRSQRTELFS